VSTKPKELKGMTTSVESVKVEIAVVLGKSVIPMYQLLRMGRGAVIELDAKQDDEVWILANNKPIARGEIMIQGDRIAVSVTDRVTDGEYHTSSQ
jgi:flagellar motor switch protein FliN